MPYTDEDDQKLVNGLFDFAAAVKAEQARKRLRVEQESLPNDLEFVETHTTNDLIAA